MCVLADLGSVLVRVLQRNRMCVCVCVNIKRFILRNWLKRSRRMASLNPKVGPQAETQEGGAVAQARSVSCSRQALS